MEQGNKDNNYSKILWVMLSALGVLTITVLAGIMLFYQKPAGFHTGGMAALQDSVNEYEAEGDGSILDAVEDVDDVVNDVEDILNNIDLDEEGLEYPGLEESDEAEDEITIRWSPDGDTDPETILEVDPDAFAERSQPERHEPVVEQTPAAVETRRVQSTVYWIQVASFPSSFKAEMLSQSLYSKGIPATIQTQDVDGQTWYRIRVGAFSSRDEADNFQQRIESLNEVEGSFIVQGSMMKEVPVTN